MRRPARAALIASVALMGGCASLLSLDELGVEKPAAAGSGGGSGASGAAGIAGSAGTAGGGAAGAGAMAGGAGKGGAGAGGAAGGGGDPDAGADADAGITPVRPPDRPPGDAGPSGKGATRAFAVKTYYLGASDPVTHQADPEAWRKLGFDFDGKCTTVTESKNDTSGVCKRVAGSPPQVLEDGEGCRDNNFGARIVGIVALGKTDLEDSLNKNVTSGSPTMMLVLSDLDSGDDPYVPGTVLITASNDDAGVPKWDGTDVKSIDAESYTGGDVTKPRTYFPKGYVKNNTWVSGDYQSSPTSFTFPVTGEPVNVSATTMVITATLDDKREKVLGADMGAVFAIGPFVEALKPALASQANCGSFGLYVDIIEKTPDLPNFAPTFVEPTKTCDALSFGVKLEMLPVQVPQKKDVVTVPKKPPPCDGGF